MDANLRKTVVVSAVSIHKGGTLTILRQTLEHLSGLRDQYRIVAVVADASLCRYEGIEYIEIPGCSGNWLRRFWAEYVTMYRISRDIARQDGREVWTWLSMHDATPRVEALHREVYCQTSFPFMRPILADLFFDPKIFAFTFMSRWIYRIGVHRNDCLIVQQNWFADAMSGMLGVPREKFRVIPPSGLPLPKGTAPRPHPSVPTFLFASTPDCHKNFETFLRASRLLEQECGPGTFRSVVTIKGDENRYAKYLRRNWGDVASVSFIGLMPIDKMDDLYRSADCLVFPSRIETWGLPISEYAAVCPGGRMILADLPYSHETSEGFPDRRFFKVRDANDLKKRMQEVLISL